MSASRIPIQNIYFLLCYAWNHLQETRYAEVRASGCDRVWDLLAKVLIRSTQQLVKRGLRRDYVTVRERRTQLKGKILFSETAQRPTFGSLAQVCEYGELASDILPNQIIRATFGLLRQCAGVPADLRRELREVAGFFDEVSDVRLQASTFRRVHVHRNMRHYRFVLDVCEFIYRQALPSEEEGVLRFRDFLRDDACMGALFEQFVRNFYANEQEAYSVGAPKIDWHVDPRLSSPGAMDLLPTMRTDIAMASADDRLIIDCKFYSDAFQRHFDRRKFSSGNLYQILAYLRNQSQMPDWQNVRGMLLYPTVDHAFDETLHLEGHSIRLVSINLNQDWRTLSSDLLALLRSPSIGNR